MGASKSRDIKDSLVALLSGLQRGGEPAFSKVVGNARGEFNDWPSIRVLPGQVDNQKGAQAQSDRDVAFIVRTHMPYTDGGTEFDAMYEYVDLIIDALDVADQNNTFGSLGVYIMSTTRGDWFDTDTQSGVVLAADINVEVSYSKNL